MRLKIGSPSFLMIIFMLAGCNSSELTRLRIENDSLRNELESQYTVLTTFKDVRPWLDSIDATRTLLLTRLEEGTTYEELSSRLKDINEFVKMSEEKIEAIQKALKSSKLESSAYLMLVDALKSEVDSRVDDIVKLNERITAYKDQNEGLEQTIRIRENEVNDINVQFSKKQQELLLLEAKIEALLNSFRVREADAYYARARAVEETARRTKLAPHKRQDTYKEALELYKMSLSLGKQEANADISRLQKKAD